MSRGSSTKDSAQKRTGRVETGKLYAVGAPRYVASSYGQLAAAKTSSARQITAAKAASRASTDSRSNADA